MSRRVVLPATEENPAQHGVTIGPPMNGVQMVRIDETDRDKYDPDGLVEVPVEILENE